MPDWVRRQFASVGVTQVPPGPYFAALQGRFGGTVMLMIDVSPSMDGAPIMQAVRGAREFIAEAVGAHYKVGLMLWNTEVVASCEPTTDGAAARRVLDPVDHARWPPGGTDLIGPLQRCHKVLDGFGGDRVVAIFGDGALGSKDRVLAQVARMKAEDIRFVTRGLGSASAREFGEISSEDPATAEVNKVEDLATGIADMATSLKQHTGLA